MRDDLPGRLRHCHAPPRLVAVAPTTAAWRLPLRCRGAAEARRSAGGVGVLDALRWRRAEAEVAGTMAGIVVGVGADGIELQPVVVQERHPADALLEASSNADLLALGSRGRGGFGGLILGSVTHAAVLHAMCPVVVVP
ncbi:MAG TPA: universal stress protein [Actinomycetes bacterium]